MAGDVGKALKRREREGWMIEYKKKKKNIVGALLYLVFGE
jgi:hypothetical protein